MKESKLKPEMMLVYTNVRLPEDYKMYLTSVAAKNNATISFRRLEGRLLPVIEIHGVYDNGKQYLENAKVLKNFKKLF